MSQRQIFDVLVSIKEIVPVSRTDVHLQLDGLLNRLGYTPPELANRCWASLSTIVTQAVGPGELEGWRAKAVALLMNLTEEAALQKFGAAT